MENISFRAGLAVAIFIMTGNIGLSADLKKCPSDVSVTWSECLGTYTWDGGSKYTGEFLDDLMHGQGKWTSKEGDVYVGSFHEGKFQGKGTYTYLSGTKYVGEWINDKYNGQGTLTSLDGTIEIGLWKEDVLQAPEGVFRIEENKLYYDTENPEGVDGINYHHVDNMFEILKYNDQIQTLVLNSGGGYTEAARELADLVIDAELNTYVENICKSACVKVFLAGTDRSLALGGKIGFHKGYWEAKSLKEYYEDNKNDEGWVDPFEFASWLFDDTQSNIFRDFEYLLERGVEAKFAIKTLKADSDGMWEPRRSELRSAGVLTQ